MIAATERIALAYETLLDAFGPQGWWPADSRFEMAAGAVLTQNTAWQNAELALRNLRGAGALTPEGLVGLEPGELEALIRPAGFARRKARTLRELASRASGTTSGWEALLDLTGERLRQELLSIWGIGPETADAIALYAGDHPTFVVDEYTRRYAVRHGLVERNATYGELRRVFTSAVRGDASAAGEFHALLVRLGKEHCGREPDCERCPLKYDLAGE